MNDQDRKARELLRHEFGMSDTTAAAMRRMDAGNETEVELAAIRAITRALTQPADQGGVARDGARLDWLEAVEAEVFRTMGSNEWAVGPDCETRKFAPTLRDAIDAAMQAANTGGERGG